MAPYEFSGAPFFLVNLLLGFGFGFTLERAGFGDSRRLAAQFYLRDMTVLKVMFTAIVTAMLLTLWASALGWLDLSRVWIQPTYLGSGVLGGFLIGVGFIVGGYCPGTSLVAASTGKLDGLFFLVGLALGSWLFGETVPHYWSFFEQSGARGVVTLDRWLGVGKGMTALLVTTIALLAFWGAEQLESSFGEGKR